jgi:hypothetical protein
VREAESSAKPGVGAERLVSLDQRPTIWYDSRAQGAGLDYIKGSPMPIREYGSLTPGPGQSPLIPDTAHQPSLAYVPYLLTGDRYYAEEMAFWGNYSMLRTYPADGVRGANGILAYNEVRGYGWALRNIADAAAGSASGYPQLSGEYIIAANPALIVLADSKCCGQTAATVSARPGWRSIAAVRNRAIVAVDDSVASRWGPRVVDFLERVVDALQQVEPAT